MTDVKDRLRDAPGLALVAERYTQLGRSAGKRLVTRFAPSPTGELHLGHVAHLLWLHGAAEVLAAETVVRIEDHDRQRCRPEFEVAILNDWEWLGLSTGSRGSDSLKQHPSSFRQSDVPERYQAAFDALVAAGLVYHCTCTRSMLGHADPDGERHYPGTCRARGYVEGGDGTVRVMLPDEAVEFKDLLLGRQVQFPLHQGGDPVIRDAQGQWTYQFSVVVDDLRHDISLIVRGVDILPSTGRQALLGRLLGRELDPVMMHHPLILSSDARKLSKRDRSETVRAMRERGMSAAEIIELAWQRSEIGERRSEVQSPISDL